MPEDSPAVQERIELGVELLDHLEDESLPLAEVITRIETITSDPAITREILDTAEMRGIIDREDGIVSVNTGTYVSFEADVIQREGEFTCRRCGTEISTGHFVTFETDEHGPFGSSCIRKVTGRE